MAGWWQRRELNRNMVKNWCLKGGQWAGPECKKTAKSVMRVQGPLVTLLVPAVGKVFPCLWCSLCLYIICFEGLPSTGLCIHQIAFNLVLFFSLVPSSFFNQLCTQNQCQNVPATFLPQQGNSSFFFKQLLPSSACLEISDLLSQVRSADHWCYLPSLGKWFAYSLICGLQCQWLEALLKVRCGGTLITCELCSWSWVGYLGNGCCWKLSWWNCILGNCLWSSRLAVNLKLSPSRVAFLALGLRSANQLLGLFLNSPMSSYFMVLTCSPAPL